MRKLKVAEYKRQWALTHRKPCKECGKLTFSKRFLCASCAKRGKRNPWYRKESPKTRYMKIANLISQNNNPKKISIGNGKRMLYSRYLMELILGRILNSEEVVHHKDGNNQNNLSTNLELMPNKSFHQRHHWRELKGKVMPI